tara:strand:+ start:161 stop:424 length:264 start_codon:yes stop_codon:yes gene_type:complete
MVACTIHGVGIGTIAGEVIQLGIRTKMKNIKKTALKWRQKMEEAPRHLCPNDLSDEAFIECLTRALWKRGMVIDTQGDFYEIRGEGV